MIHREAKEVVVIAGVGEGTGASLVRKFVSEGCDVAMLARSEGTLHALADACIGLPGRVISLPCDITDEQRVAEAFEHIRNSVGPVSVLINHASGTNWAGIDDTDARTFERTWRATTLGAYLCCRQAVRDMRERGKGTILFTGATSSVRGRKGAVAFSSAKFALRGLAWSLAAELTPQGIHVAHVVIDGVIETPHSQAEGPVLQPDSIADAYWMLTQQHPSAWTFELDLRPQGEAFFE